MGSALKESIGHADTVEMPDTVETHSAQRSRVVRLVAAGVVLALAAVSGIAPALAEDKPTLLGLATQEWRVDFPDFVAEAGKFPAIRQVFWPLDLEFGKAYQLEVLNANHGWGMATWQMTHVDDLDAFNQGEYDDNLAAMVAMYRDWMADDPERRAIIAPFPEANLTGHPWSGDPSGYKSAYLRIRNAFRSAGIGPSQVRFAFVMNGISSAGYSYDQFYPGDDAVDLLAFNKHNRNIVLSSDDPWRDYETTFGMHIKEMSRLVSRSKPIFINQTASVDDDGRRSQWLDDMFQGLASEPQVIGAIYFNRLKAEGDLLHDFRVLVDGALDPAFKSGYLGWSDPADVAWIFDGRMDAWVADRETEWETEGETDGETDRHFDDADASSPFADDIEWLFSTGITKGCNPPENTRFCPEQDVTRAQMAAFLARARQLPASSGDWFDDDDGSVLEDSINRLADAGITKGCGPREFCPDRPVSRAEMAAFLVRVLGLTDPGSDAFGDDDDSIFHGDINKLAASGITKGCNPPANDRFCPRDPVTREQMAAFLHRALG